MDGRPASPAQRSARGRQAERLAERYLRAQGYEILARNVRFRRGEIDIIARDRGEIVFVEVRSRRAGSCRSPEFLSLAKRRALLRAAAQWVGREGHGNTFCRFDLVTVRFASQEARLEHHRGAFVDDLDE
ncbi:MAG: YraN family protein [Acidobacteriota bacterium]|nr:YraN family protein [Acidobacteriota bacterium]MDQ7086708.1 YraN family protein [Acidobacteriota bacterium]